MTPSDLRRPPVLAADKRQPTEPATRPPLLATDNCRVKATEIGDCHWQAVGVERRVPEAGRCQRQ